MNHEYRWKFGKDGRYLCSRHDDRTVSVFLLGLSTMQIGVIWNRMQDFLRRIFSGQ